MIAIAAKLNPADLAAFNRAMEMATHVTGRTADRALDWFGVRYAKSARALTPTAKKYRKVVDNPNPKARFPFAIEILRQGKPPKYAPLARKIGYRQHPRAEIKKRGLGKLTWRVMAAKIAAGAAGDEGGTVGSLAIPSGFAPVAFKSGGRVRTLSTEQRLTYIDRAVSGIDSLAIGRASRGIVGEIERRLQRDLDAARVGSK